MIKMPRKRRRDSSEVSCVVKYLMFAFNVLFWLLGAAVCAIGLWAWTEKDTFTNIGRLTNVALDPAMLFIITGGVMFVIGFAGCVGALRENTKLLLFFCVCVGLIFFLELTIGILAFVYKNWVKDQIESQISNMIVNYRDDPDLQNLVDWVQRDWLKCCGVSGYQNWENNIYFNCSSPGGEACGVPFSCCRPTDEPELFRGLMVWVRLPGMKILWPAKIEEIAQEEYVVFIKSDNESFVVKKSEASIKLFREDVIALKTEGIEYLKKKKMISLLKCFKDDVEWADIEDRSNNQTKDSSSEEECVDDSYDETYKPLSDEGTDNKPLSDEGTDNKPLSDEGTDNKPLSDEGTDSDMDSGHLMPSYGKKAGKGKLNKDLYVRSNDQTKDSSSEEECVDDSYDETYKPLSDEGTDNKPLSDEGTDKKPLSDEGTDNKPLSDEGTDSDMDSSHLMPSYGKKAGKGKLNKDLYVRSNDQTKDSSSEEECVDDSYDETYKPLSDECTDNKPLSDEGTDNKPLSDEGTDNKPLSDEGTDSDMDSGHLMPSYGKKAGKGKLNKDLYVRSNDQTKDSSSEEECVDDSYDETYKPLSDECTDNKPLSDEGTDNKPLSDEGTDNKPLSDEGTDNKPLSDEGTDSDMDSGHLMPSYGKKAGKGKLNKDLYVRSNDQTKDSSSEEECVDDSYDETYKPLSDEGTDSDMDSGHLMPSYGKKAGKGKLNKDLYVEASCSEGELSDVYPMLTQTSTFNVEYDSGFEAPVLTERNRLNVESDDSSEDDIDEESILRDSKNPQIYISRVLNSKTTKSGKAKKNSRVYNSYQYCGSCKKKVSNFAQHLIDRNKGSHHVHNANPEIKEIREENVEKKKKMLQMILRAKFNHNFNLNTLKKGKGEILLERRPVNEFRAIDYGPCPNCLFWFAKRLLKKHEKKCINKNSIPQSIADLTTQSDCLSGQLKSVASKRLLKEVFSKMQRDEVSEVVKKDILITQLGNQWLEKNVGNVLKRGVYTSQILRLIGRFLIILRRIKPLKEQREASMWDYLKPCHFDSVVEACILTATPIEDEESLKAPSNAIKLGYDIKRLLSGKIGLSIIQNDQGSQVEAEKMLKLIDIYWATKVTKAARVILLERSYYAKKNLPVPEDIQRLNVYLRETISELDYSVVDKTNHRQIVEAVQAKLVLYNRRRTGEVQAARLRDYERRCTGTDGEHLVGECSALEKKLLESQEVMTIRGKIGRAVPVILPNEIKQGLSYLADPKVRAAAGISSSNNYLFASEGQSIVWAYDSLKKATLAADLQNPAAMTSTNLRKYMATVTQVLDLKESQMQWVVNHLGHTMDVHKLHYRATSDILERTQIAKILLLQDQGRIGLFKNKSLDDISLEDLVFEEPCPPNVPEGREEFVQEPASAFISPDVIDEALDEAEAFFEKRGENKKQRKKPVTTTKVYWSLEEENEIKSRFRHFFEKKVRPKPKDCLRAILKSQKEKGLLGNRKKDVLKKKIFRMIDKL